MKRLLIRGARQLLTLRGSPSPRRGMDHQQLGIIEDGAVLVEYGSIREVGLTRRVENLAGARGAEVIDATGCVVMPGFVDAHTHLMPTEVGLMRRRPTSALAALEGFAAHGTTTLGVDSGVGSTEDDELNALRALSALAQHELDIVPNFRAGHSLPAEFAGRPWEYGDWLMEHLLPAVGKKGLARFFHLSFAAGGLDAASARRCLERARSCRLSARVSFGREERVAPIQFAIDAGVVSVDHLEHADDADVTAIASSGAIAVVLPASAFYLNDGRYAPARDLIDFGTAVALGSDYSPEYAACRSMQFVIFLACRQLRMTVEEAISAATINAAHALGAAKRVGSIEPGKQADLICLRTNDYRTLGVEFGGNLVGMTIKRGDLIYDGMIHRAKTA